MDKHIDGDDAVNDQHIDHTDQTHHDEPAAVAVTPDTAGHTGTAERTEDQQVSSDSLADLDTPGHVFDQTNGLADGLEGDSDGTAESDVASDAERGGDGTSTGIAGTGSDGAAFNPNDRV
jgi:hypothetical protein